jgi:transketolase
MSTIPMREQMVRTIHDLFERDDRLALLLAEITRAPFEPLFRRFPRRTVNVGIMEQALIGVAAGMALEGFIPVVHTIAPFLVERPLEQLKNDFLYQGLRGNFIGVGGSHDYSTSGMTHHAPGDILALRSLPGMQIVVPGTSAEFDQLLRASYANDAATYFRLSIPANVRSHPVAFGKLLAVRTGGRTTVLAVGPMLDRVLAAVADLDVTVLYCTTVTPFDHAGLRAMHNGDALVVVEPGYPGALLPEVCGALEDRPTRIVSLGLRREVLHRYGTIEQLDEALGLTEDAIRQAVMRAASPVTSGV